MLISQLLPPVDGVRTIHLDINVLHDHMHNKVGKIKQLLLQFDGTMTANLGIGKPHGQLGRITGSITCTKERGRKINELVNLKYVHTPSTLYKLQ